MCKTLMLSLLLATLCFCIQVSSSAELEPRIAIITQAMIDSKGRTIKKSLEDNIQAFNEQLKKLLEYGNSEASTLIFDLTENTERKSQKIENLIGKVTAEKKDPTPCIDPDYKNLQSVVINDCTDIIHDGIDGKINIGQNALNKYMLKQDEYTRKANRIMEDSRATFLGINKLPYLNDINSLLDKTKTLITDTSAEISKSKMDILIVIVDSRKTCVDKINTMSNTIVTCLNKLL